MWEKFTIQFVLATLLLVICEYIFLQEIVSGKRTLVVIVSLLGILLASYFFFLFFTKYHKAIKDS